MAVQRQHQQHACMRMGRGSSRSQLRTCVAGIAWPRAADLSHNRLTALPASLCQLSSLGSLKLAHNRLVDGGVPWPQLCAGLAGLTSLLLGSNQLRRLPACMGQLTGLVQLGLEANCLAEVEPGALQGLRRLEVLQLQDNQLAVLPAEIGARMRACVCDALLLQSAQPPSCCITCLLRTRRQLHQSCGAERVAQQPGCAARRAVQPRAAASAGGRQQQVRACQRVVCVGPGCNRAAISCCVRGPGSHHTHRCTHARRLAALPPRLFVGCSSLATLSAHANPITVEALRSAEGFAGYDARRQARASKQLGGRVMADLDRAFSEGADVEQWQRWAAGPAGLGSDGSGRAGK